MSLPVKIADNIGMLSAAPPVPRSPSGKRRRAVGRESGPNPNSLAWPSALAHIQAELGRQVAQTGSGTQGEDHFESAARPTAQLSFLAYLVSTSAFLGDSAGAEILYKLLLPLDGQDIVAGSVVCHVPVSLLLGLVASTLGRFDDASRHLAAALETTGKTAVRPAVETRDAPARTIGMNGPIAKIEPLKKTACVDTNVFRQEERHWKIVYEGRLMRLRDTRGLHYLAHLLKNPGREFHVIDLASTLEAHGGGSERPSVEEPRARAGDLDRMESLRAELAEATSWSDAGRVESIQSTIDSMTKRLVENYGAGVSEKARKAVTKRIRDAISSIRDKDSSLGRHLDNSVTTGAYCCHRPVEPTRWLF